MLKESPDGRIGLAVTPTDGAQDAEIMLPQLNLICYPASQGEWRMPITYINFFQKWELFDKFCESYLRDTSFKIDRFAIKDAVRSPETRTVRLTAQRRATVDQVFSQKLNAGPRQQHVAWICEEIQRQVPFLDLTHDIWSDDCDAVAFCGILDRKAMHAELGNNRVAAAMALAATLQIVLMGTERLLGDDPLKSDIFLSLALEADTRGLSQAKLAPDPRKFRVGEQVVLRISPPAGASGQFDLYLWESWNPNSAALPEHERRAPWERDAKPILQPIPPLFDQTLPRNEKELLGIPSKLTDATGHGWHYIQLFGVNRTSRNTKIGELAENLRRIVATYHDDNPEDDAGVYDLRTHERIIREIYFFVGSQRARIEGGLVGADPDVFVGRCAYEIVE